MKGLTVTTKITYMREHLCEIAKNAEHEQDKKEQIEQELNGEWQQRVEEIYGMIFEAAREGKYEYAIGAYLEEYNQLTYGKIVNELKKRLGNVIIICSRNRRVLTISWASNEA
jgi:hypothetical protein